MIRAAVPTAAPPHSLPEAHRIAPRIEPPPRPVYGAAFWFAYTANWLMMVAVALLYRYADFITLLGGTEFHLGWIVGVGMVGSLVVRLALGSAIDRRGTKAVWLASTFLFAVACFAHLAVESHTGAAVYGWRIVLSSALAGMQGAATTFASHRAPARRMAEMVGIMGTAGFLGSLTGALLGDWLFGSVAIDGGQVSGMFVAAGLTALASLPFAWLATRTESRPDHTSHLPLRNLLRQHLPGAVLMVGVGMGVGLGLPNTFLRTFAAQLHIPRIGVFFTIYAVAAILTRISTRRWAERFGNRPIILLGTAGMVAALLLFLPVRSEWQLFLPAVGFGFSHALLFPAVAAAGSLAFPPQHRGLAMVLMLATWDVGQLIGAPLAGLLVHYSEPAGLPPYPTMFLVIAAMLAMVGVGYAALSRPE